MAVNVSLTPEQAALLQPFLLSFSAGKLPTTMDTNQQTPTGLAMNGECFSTPSPSASASESALSSGSSTSAGYRVDDLLQRKGKNNKSSCAQAYLLVKVCVCPFVRVCA